MSSGEELPRAASEDVGENGSLVSLVHGSSLKVQINSKKHQKTKTSPIKIEECYAPFSYSSNEELLDEQPQQTNHASVFLFSRYTKHSKVSKRMRAYWNRRHLLFSKFDEGIILDAESLFSVTPELIALHIAQRCRFKMTGVVLDPFCGAGGNTIQFALLYDFVIAIDIDPIKIELARNNARVYGVEDKIEFLCADFLSLDMSHFAVDIVFLSPPWGGPNVSHRRDFRLEMMGLNGVEFFDKCRRVCSNIVLYVPRTANIKQLSELVNQSEQFEVEQLHLNNRCIALAAYYGQLVNDEYVAPENHTDKNM